MNTNNNEKLNLEHAFISSWQKYKQNFVTLSITSIIYLLFVTGSAHILFKMIPIGPSLAWGSISQLIFSLVGLFLTVGFFKIATEIVDNKNTNWTDLFKNGRFLITYFITHIIFALIVLVGLILIIVPGIMWAVQFSFYPLFVIDRNLGPIDALKASSMITRGYKWQLAGFYILVIIGNGIGFALFGIGAIFTIPFTLLTYAYIYRKLS